MEMVSILELAKYVGLSVLSKGENISPLKLQKLLYYIQAWYMVLTTNENNTLFVESPEAWVNGPVYPNVFYAYKSKVGNMCEHLHACDFGCEDDDILDTISNLARTLPLSKEQIELIDSVITLYGTKSQNQLIFMTHSEKPWSEARGNLLPYEKSNNKISLHTMYTYYKERYDANRNR